MTPDLALLCPCLHPSASACAVLSLQLSLVVYNDAASVPVDLEIKAVILAYDVLEVRPLFSPRMHPTMCATLFGL